MSHRNLTFKDRAQIELGLKQNMTNVAIAILDTITVSSYSARSSSIVTIRLKLLSVDTSLIDPTNPKGQYTRSILRLRPS